MQAHVYDGMGRFQGTFPLEEAQELCLNHEEWTYHEVEFIPQYPVDVEYRLYVRELGSGKKTRTKHVFFELKKAMNKAKQLNNYFAKQHGDGVLHVQIVEEPMW